MTIRVYGRSCGKPTAMSEADDKKAEIDRAVLDFLFTTVTNVDFDPQRVHGYLLDAAIIRDKAKSLYETACIEIGRSPEANPHYEQARRLRPDLPPWRN